MKRYSFYEEQVLKYYSRTGDRYEGHKGGGVVTYVRRMKSASPTIDMETSRKIRRYKPSNILNARTTLTQ